MRRVKGEECNLSNLKVGQSGIIIDLQIEDKTLKRHLLEMGLIDGTKVKVKKKAPFGEPTVVELRGYELFLEKQELRKIKVEVL